jgi:hypothetical protein
MNKLTNPKNDLTILAKTKLCHFLINLIFFGLGLTPS